MKEDNILEDANSYSYYTNHIQKTKKQIMALESKYNSLGRTINSLKEKLEMMKKMRSPYLKGATEYNKRFSHDKKK